MGTRGFLLLTIAIFGIRGDDKIQIMGSRLTDSRSFFLFFCFLFALFFSGWDFYV